MLNWLLKRTELGMPRTLLQMQVRIASAHRTLRASATTSAANIALQDSRMILEFLYEPGGVAGIDDDAAAPPAAGKKRADSRTALAQLRSLARNSLHLASLIL